MNQKFWQKTEKSIVIGKLNNTITLEAFSASCGWFGTNSLYLTSDGTNQVYVDHVVINNSDPVTNVSVEAWIKLKRFPSSGNVATIFSRSLLYAAFQITVRINSSGYLQFLLLKGGVTTTLTSAQKVSTGVWTFITASWDGITMQFFVNGVADANMQAFSGPLDPCNIGPRNAIGTAGSAFSEDFNGWIAEVRIWNAGRTSQEIISTYKGPRNYNYGSGIDDDLIYYYKCNEGSALSVNEFVNTEVAQVVLVNVGGLVSTDGPPLEYGASFPAAEFAAILNSPFSLVYPVDPPSEDINFALVVRWVDSSDKVQRRYLWTVDGVKLLPEVTPYKGERIANSFVLECWNIDGQATIDLEDDLILDTTIRTLPTTSIDEVKPNLETIAINSSLMALFPFTFPVTFNQPFGFILPSGAIPPIPTNIGNVLGEDGSVLGDGSTGLQ